MSNNVRVVEVIPNGPGKYTLEESYVNPSWVTRIHISRDTKRLQESGHLPKELNEAQIFSTLYLANGQVMTVVGEPSHVQRLLSPTQILKG